MILKALCSNAPLLGSDAGQQKEIVRIKIDQSDPGISDSPLLLIDLFLCRDEEVLFFQFVKRQLLIEVTVGAYLDRRA